MYVEVAGEPPPAIISSYTDTKKWIYVDQWTRAHLVLMCFLHTFTAYTSGWCVLYKHPTL